MSKLKRKIRQKTEPPQTTKPSPRETRRAHQDIPAGAPPGFGSRRAELERMLREQFPEEGKKERIRKGLGRWKRCARTPCLMSTWKLSSGSLKIPIWLNSKGPQWPSALWLISHPV